MLPPPPICLPPPTTPGPVPAVADDICTMSDAHSIYPKLGMLANVGLVVSGRLIAFVNTHLARE